MKARKRAEEILAYLESMKDDEGHIAIDVNISNTPLYDELSVGSNLDLNGAIYDFIDREANLIPAKIPLKIRFVGRDVSPEEQAEIRRIMHKHYTLKSLDITWDKAANFKKMVGLSLFGVAVLAAYFLLSVFDGNPMITEILSIIGSFSLWEATGSYLLDRPQLRREHANVMQNINQKIEFIGTSQTPAQEQKVAYIAQNSGILPSADAPRTGAQTAALTDAEANANAPSPATDKNKKNPSAE